MYKLWGVSGPWLTKPLQSVMVSVYSAPLPFWSASLLDSPTSRQKAIKKQNKIDILTSTSITRSYINMDGDCNSETYHAAIWHECRIPISHSFPQQSMAPLQTGATMYDSLESLEYILMYTGIFCFVTVLWNILHFTSFNRWKSKTTNPRI